MDKKRFNQIIKQYMLSNGFEKTGALSYAKEAQDGITKIVIRVPDQISGFGIGVQFKDFGGYSGKVSQICMSNSMFSTVLCAASIHDYSEENVESGVKTVLNGIEVLLKEGKAAIRNQIDQWTLGLLSEKEKNDIYSYFGLPLIDPYSESYMLNKIEDWLKQGGCISMSLTEYQEHKAYYDKYVEHGAKMNIGKEYVTISYDCYPKKY